MNCAHRLPIARARLEKFGGFFNCDEKAQRIINIDSQLQNSEIWQDTNKTATLQRERARLENDVNDIVRLEKTAAESLSLLTMAEEEKDALMLEEIRGDITRLSEQVKDLSMRQLFSGEHDEGDCFLTVQAGSGGTEAQDWAAMLFRMYLRYADAKLFSSEILEESAGEVTGIKGASVKVSGHFAYGYLRVESGVHRLVRKSPFDANHKRHTSFASVFVYPALERDNNIDINPADLRIDTYRSSGAGGQHVNTTDSAVRVTHIPTRIIVQCQNDRSQHKNKAQAMAMLKARLYQHQQEIDNAEKNRIEKTKEDITWGSQIRSYVLDQSRIKDLRSGYEAGNTRAILDGDLDGFIRAGLLWAGKR